MPNDTWWWTKRALQSRANTICPTQYCGHGYHQSFRMLWIENVTSCVERRVDKEVDTAIDTVHGYNTAMISVQERTQYWRRVKTRVCCWSSRRSCTCFKRVLVAYQMISLTKWHDESTWPFCRREQDSRRALVWLWLDAKYPLRMIWFGETSWRQTFHCKHSHAKSSSPKWCPSSRSLLVGEVHCRVR